jgi:photosystem II stability/assembly factor-like uncharacterized protein
VHQVFHIVVLCGLQCLVSVAFAQWQWQNPLPQGQTLNSIIFIDESTGWAASNGGTLVKTTDGGGTFQIIELQSLRYASVVFFLNNQKGWVGGQRDNLAGVLLATVDGGASWSTQLVDSSFWPSVRPMFIDELQGWLSGGSNIWHTNDGGLSWELQATFPGNYVASITMFDSLSGIGAGDIGVRTSDGGVTWEIDSNVIPSSEMVFVDSLRGWARYGGAIYRTNDGGTSWETQLDTNGVLWRDIFMWDDQTGWVVSGTSGEGLIIKTTNGGDTWMYVDNRGDELLNSVAFRDIKNGLTVGNWGAILKTSDGGSTWTSVTTQITWQHLKGIQFLDESTGWIVGESGVLLATQNGGTSWASLPSGTSEGLTDVYFINTQEGWIVGNASIRRTTNGGSTWLALSPPVARPWDDIEFRYHPSGWIVGGDILSDGRILKTTDGGISWSDVTNIAIPGSSHRIQFTSEEVGWLMASGGVSGSSQLLYRTSDAGTSWTLVLSGTTDTAFSSISFVSDSTGWVSTYQDAIYRTNDAGTSWDILATPSHFRSIYFIDSLRGWGGESAGDAIYQTIDGGQSWTMQFTRITGPVYGLFVTESEHGWAVGTWGGILHTSNGGVSFLEEGVPVESSPTDFILYSNFPNPFNSSTSIRCRVINPVHSLSLRIYDFLGREVHNFFLEEPPQGINEIRWNGTNLHRSPVASGVYIYIVRTNKSMKFGKAVVIR